MPGEKTVKARVEGWTQNPSNDQEITVEYTLILSNGEDSHHGSTMMQFVPAYAFEGIGKGDIAWITTRDGRINPKTNNPYRDFHSVSKTPPNHHDGANGYANGGPESPIEPRSHGFPCCSPRPSPIAPYIERQLASSRLCGRPSYPSLLVSFLFRCRGRRILLYFGSFDRGHYIAPFFAAATTPK